MWAAKTDQPACLYSLIRVLADRMCLLQPPGYLKRNKQEPLPYWVDVQADLSLCWLHRSYCRFCLELARISTFFDWEKCLTWSYGRQPVKGFDGCRCKIINMHIKLSKPHLDVMGGVYNYNLMLIIVFCFHKKLNKVFNSCQNILVYGLLCFLLHFVSHATTQLQNARFTYTTTSL